jgi:hypothetical protein
VLRPADKTWAYTSTSLLFVSGPASIRASNSVDLILHCCSTMAKRILSMCLEGVSGEGRGAFTKLLFEGSQGGCDEEQVGVGLLSLMLII